MTHRDNVTSRIDVPNFINLTLCNFGYVMSVNLNISERVADKVSKKITKYNGEPIKVSLVHNSKGMWFLHAEKVFDYNTQFIDSVRVMRGVLNTLMVQIRAIKISLLQTEINQIMTISTDSKIQL